MAYQYMWPYNLVMHVQVEKYRQFNENEKFFDAASKLTTVLDKKRFTVVRE